MLKTRLKVFLLAMVFVIGMSGSAMASDIVIDGSTTVLPIAQLAVERFMAANPEIGISLSGGGTGHGIRGLIDGTVHIANSSREIRQSEIDQASANGVIPYQTIVAFDSIVPIVHRTNPVQNLTFEQLKGIYTGVITNWSEVGGPDSPIAVIGRDSSSGTFATWQEMVVDRGGQARVTPRALIAPSSGGMLSMVAGNPFAIGYDGIGYVDESVNGVAVEGVTASLETTMDGSFPLARPLYMYTSGEPTGNVRAFLDFLLSPEGQMIVTEAGFVPLH